MNLRLASEAPKELASGIDSLYLSAWAKPRDFLSERLYEAKREAVTIESSVPFHFGGHDFELQPKRWQRYPYLLTFDGGRIGVCLGGAIPTVRFQPFGEWLHGHGVAYVVEWFEQLLEHLTFVRITVSRVDLFADFEGLAITMDDLPQFVGRARARQAYEEDNRWTGFIFGKRKTGTISARIYDKTEQLEHFRAGYWAEVWGRPIEGPQVTRVEFELTSAGLRDFGSTEPAEVIAAAGSLWMWLTTDWLTLREESDDETKARWPMSSRWQAVQRARIAEEAVGIDRVRAGSRRADLQWYAPRLLSSMAAVAVLLGTDDLDATLDALPLLASGVEAASGRSFEERIAQRKKST